jgi:hypothetical protein
MLLCLKTETEPASEMCFFKNLDDGQTQKQKTVSVNFSQALFLLSIFDDLAMQALVWLHMVWFRAIQFGEVQFDDSYTYLIPHIFKHQIHRKNYSCVQVNTVTLVNNFQLFFDNIDGIRWFLLPQ